MDHKVASTDELDVEYLAYKYWLPVEQVKHVIDLTGSRSRDEIERALALARTGKYG